MANPHALLALPIYSQKAYKQRRNRRPYFTNYSKMKRRAF
jgi:hypothetical protein